MKIAVVGTGYVGLVSGTCFAEVGHEVICVDIDEAKVERMRAGEIPIYEPGLEVIFQRNIRQGRLRFTTELSEAVKDSIVIFLALPTPPGGDGAADLSFVLGVSRELGQMIEEYKIIVDKSTVPVGTAEKVEAAVKENATVDFDVVSNPEFLREGAAVDDFMKPDRVVIGTRSEKAREIMSHLYEPFVRQGNPIIFMDERSAEMTKYAANSYLATRISFMNEIANLCERVGANVNDVRRGIGSDTRIGKRFLFPGVGYGGSCFPKDVQALYLTSQENKYDFEILRSVMEVNNRQKIILSEKIASYFNGDLKGKRIAVWGLSFKPNTDDIREAPSQYIINALLDAGATVKAFDPEAMDNFKSMMGDKIEYSQGIYDCLEGADALAIITEWTVFRAPDFSRMKGLMNAPVIFDGRNLYGLDDMENLGFYYNSIGRKVING